MEMDNSSAFFFYVLFETNDYFIKSKARNLKHRSIIPDYLIIVARMLGC